VQGIWSFTDGGPFNEYRTEEQGIRIRIRMKKENIYNSVLRLYNLDSDV